MLTEMKRVLDEKDADVNSVKIHDRLARRKPEVGKLEDRIKKNAQKISETQSHLDLIHAVHDFYVDLFILMSRFDKQLFVDVMGMSPANTILNKFLSMKPSSMLSDYENQYAAPPSPEIPDNPKGTERRRLPASTTTSHADAVAIPLTATASTIAPPEPTFTTTNTILASAGICLAGFIIWRVTRWLRAKPRPVDPVEDPEDSPV